jgi:hypothetical protein
MGFGIPDFRGRRRDERAKALTERVTRIIGDPGVHHFVIPQTNALVTINVEVLERLCAMIDGEAAERDVMLARERQAREREALWTPESPPDGRKERRLWDPEA